jgi:hypothetical protein
MRGRRCLDGLEQDRLYRQHLKAIESMKPSIDSHQEPLKKFRKIQRKDKAPRRFDGAKVRHAPRTAEPDSEAMSTRSEPQTRAATAMANVAQIPRRAISARAVHSKLPVRGARRPAGGEEKRAAAEPSDDAPSCPADPVLTVSFGADMWDTSDEMEEERRTDSDCFDLDFGDF